MSGVRKFDRKTRILYFGGLLCGVVGILLQNLEAELRYAHRGLFDGARGLLMGLGIGMLLWVLLRRRCQPEAGGKKS